MGHDTTTKPATDDSNEQTKGAVIGERFACQHYKRKCQFVSPCCQKIYRCRFCHDDAENHVLDRFAVREVVCSNCNLKQEIQSSCEGCGTVFGAYSCLKCKLFDDDPNRCQYHCEGCGICRVGKSSNYFHCDKCDMCLPVHMQGKHTCIESVSRKDCPVCLEDIHTSREPSQIPPCHHLIHRSCFNQLRLKGIYRCPICLKSMFNIPWDDYDLMLANNPMPHRFLGVMAKIKCFDCDSNGETEFHFVSLKCGACGSHNTARGTGPLFKMVDGQEVEFDIQSVTTAADNTTPRSASTPPSGTPSAAAGELYNSPSPSESSDDTTSSWADLEAEATGVSVEENNNQSSRDEPNNNDDDSSSISDDSSLTTTADEEENL